MNMLPPAKKSWRSSQRKFTTSASRMICNWCQKVSEFSPSLSASSTLGNGISGSSMSRGGSRTVDMIHLDRGHPCTHYTCGRRRGARRAVSEPNKREKRSDQLLLVRQERHAHALADARRRRFGGDVDDDFERADVVDLVRLELNEALGADPFGDGLDASFPADGAARIVFDDGVLADKDAVGPLLQNLGADDLDLFPFAVGLQTLGRNLPGGRLRVGSSQFAGLDVDAKDRTGCVCLQFALIERKLSVVALRLRDLHTLLGSPHLQLGLLILDPLQLVLLVRVLGLSLADVGLGLAYIELIRLLLNK